MRPRGVHALDIRTGDQRHLGRRYIGSGHHQLVPIAWPFLTGAGIGRS